MEALTHRSYQRDNDPREAPAYERLEFLGDSVLGLVVADELFRDYPEMLEGELTKSKALLVNGKALAYAGNSIGLGEYILMSVEEAGAGGRQRASIIADCMEALIGAVYEDGGLSVARDIIKKLISFDFIQTRRELSLRNYKGDLLELLQSQGIAMPKYTVTDESGPDHRKSFTVDVFVTDRKLGTGRGDSKKSAEQRAAREALIAIRRNKASNRSKS